ncbi:MAG: hypothetical protein U0802_11615 [Candidatus Binatia bacterium]
MPALRVEAIAKRYGAIEAVREASFEVRAGRCSGCSAPTAPARPAPSP